MWEALVVKQLKPHQLIFDKHYSPTHWPLYLTKWNLDSGGGNYVSKEYVCGERGVGLAVL